MKVEITQFWIAAGKRGSPGHCAIASALRWLTEDEWWVDYDRVSFWDGNQFVSANLPDWCGELLRMWDRGHPMVPFTLHLEVSRPRRPSGTKSTRPRGQLVGSLNGE